MALIKCINSESKQYKPVLTDKLVLDAVPTVNSLNSVTSDAVARAVAGASGEVPQVTENDNGKVLKAIYDEGGPAVEWAEQTIPTVDQNYSASSTNAQSGTAVAQAIAAIPSASYTAGDGVDITANEVSVKAGNGLEIGDVSTSTSVTLSSQTVFHSDDGYVIMDICPLTADLLAKMASGLAVTLSGSYYRFNSTYAALYSFENDQISWNPNNYLVLGSELTPTGSYIPEGATVQFDTRTIDSAKSNATLETIQNNISHYHIGLIQDGSWSATPHYPACACLFLGGSSEGRETATYTETVTIHDALNVSNPLPTSAVGDAGKVLTVNNAGAAEWATPSGGGSSFTLTKVGTVTTYLPESGSLSLTFATMSPEQSNFIDPTKLYILKVDVSCVDSGGLSFGSAPYFALTSYNTEYNAVNRTHLSYAFPQIGSYSMSSSASTNMPVYFFNEVANSLHIAPTGGQENDLKIEVGGVNSESYHSHRITVDLYMVN